MADGTKQVRTVFRDCGGCGCGCPSVHTLPDGKVVLQGYKLTDPAVRAELGIPEGEDAVVISAEQAAKFGSALGSL
jgi:hypothetical protein